MSCAPMPGTCVTCGAELAGPFCAECGERVTADDDARFIPFVLEAVSDAFDADSRFWRSFRALVAKPGLLTAEYLTGRRKPYLGPVQVFLIANVIFFAALNLGLGFNTFTTQLHYHIGQPGYGPMAERMIAQYGEHDTAEHDAYTSRFDEATPRYANSLIILMVPMMAFVLWLLYAGRRPFLHHVITSLHLFAFLMLLMIAVPLLATLIAVVVPAAMMQLNNEMAMLLLLGGVLSFYLGAGLRRAYGGSWVSAMLRGVLAFIALYPILTFYRMLLFLAVYYSLNA